MSNRHVWSRWALAAALAPTTVAAQTFTYSFEELQRMLQVGEKVAVTDETGRETTGKVADLSASNLVIRARRDIRTFSAPDVIQIRRIDSDWDGVLMGLGAGYLARWRFVRYNCGPAGYDDECAAIAGLAGLVFIPAGAVVGALIDRAVGNNPVYFASPRAVQSSVGISPLLGKARTGISLSLRF